MKHIKTRALFFKTYVLCAGCLLFCFTSCSDLPTKQAAIVDTIRVSVVEPPIVNRDTSYLEYVFKNYDLVNIAALDTSIRIDLRYSGTANFLKKDMYDGLRNAYLNCETAIKLTNAQLYLKRENPLLSLVILDASRPQHIQQLMWDSLDMLPDLKYNYLAPPYETSMHNYGCAVDVTILDLSSGKPLDMGSDYDFFGKISEPIYEAKFLKTGELSKTAYENRLLLRKAMLKARFKPINSEWWHFSICAKGEAVAKFKLIK